MSGHSHFAESVEEYLEAIYRLEREGPGVSTSGLASELGVAPASVSGMLKKLARDGFVTQLSRGNIELTEHGALVGARVVRRHRLAERWLTDVLGIAWDEVQSEACMLEHAISDRVEERLSTLLGNPTTCPHGLPIPPRDGSRVERIGAPLAQFDVGAHVRICGVTEEVPEMLHYLGEIGMRPGVNVHIRLKAPLGGPITVAFDDHEHAISLELARTILAE
ncbi:MAG: metal-dependent transcriptional regulator [Vulcanimicrobiaceae bacterium]